MDRLIATRVFLTVVEQGSLTKASNLLGISASKVSRHIASLETWLNIRLLHRTTRNISITEAGMSSLDAFYQLLNTADKLEEHYNGLNSEPQGRLRIATPPMFGQNLLLPALFSFQNNHPKVELTILGSNLTTDLISNRVDLSIHISETLENNFITKFLGEWPLTICASPKYLENHGVPYSPFDLSNHHFICHSLFDNTNRILTLDGKTLNIEPSRKLITNEVGFMVQAAEEGLGVAALPIIYIKRQLDDGRLVRILPEVRPNSVKFYAAYLSKHNQPLALKALIEHLSNYFSLHQALK